MLDQVDFPSELECDVVTAEDGGGLQVGSRHGKLAARRILDSAVASRGDAGNGSPA